MTGPKTEVKIWSSRSDLDPGDPFHDEFGSYDRFRLAHVCLAVERERRARP